MKTCPNCGASSADTSVFCMNCGARLPEPAPVIRDTAPDTQPAPVQQPAYNTYNTYNTASPVPPTVVVNNVMSTESYFDGTLGQQIGIAIVNFLLCLITLSIYAPWGFCRAYRWETQHTVINGRRLRFDGTGGSLFGQWIKWALLSLITCGIYSLWVGIKLKQWQVKHTHFAN